jgi:hypothetical protein
MADLDDRRFAVRERAVRELKALGEPAVPALRQALRGGPALETRRRAEQLLEGLLRVPITGEALRSLRAVEVLERVGTAEAKGVLERLAGGEPEARLTCEAKASLNRLGRRSFGIP